MMERIMFDDAWDDLKNENENSKIVFGTAEKISDIIVQLIVARVDQGYTQRQLAARCGLKQSAIARMESLKSIPRLDTVIRVASALNLELGLDSKTAIIDSLGYTSDIGEIKRVSDSKYLVSIIESSFPQYDYHTKEVG